MLQRAFVENELGTALLWFVCWWEVMALHYLLNAPHWRLARVESPTLVLVSIFLMITGCASLGEPGLRHSENIEPLVETNSFLTIGYGGTEAEARVDALQKALRLSTGPWISPKFGTERTQVINTVLQSGGSEFIRKVDLRLQGVSGPSRFVLAETSLDQESLFKALDRAVTGPESEPAPAEPEPVSWWEGMVGKLKSLFGWSDGKKQAQPAKLSMELENEVAAAFVPVADTDPASGAGAFGRGLLHYYVEPFSRPRDYLMADVIDVGLADGALKSEINALSVEVRLTPHKRVIDGLNGFLQSHASGRVDHRRCLAFAPNSDGQQQFYVYRSCRTFTAAYPESTSMLALHFVGASGVIGTMMLADDPFRIGFGERYLQKHETLYVRHSDAEYAAWAWRPDVSRMRGRDSDFHVMPYATLECGEDRIGVCTDWSKRYRLLLGVHGGNEQRIRLTLGDMPTAVMRKTRMVLAEVVEVREGEVISDMLPPGVRLTPEDPPPPLSHPLDEGVFAVGRSY